jgi:hypothetical protein
MRIIEHSTTPHEVVNSLFPLGDEIQKRTVHITAFLVHSMLYKPSVSPPARLPYPTHYQWPQNFLKPPVSGIVSSLFALGSILGFIALH